MKKVLIIVTTIFAIFSLSGCGGGGSSSDNKAKLAKATYENALKVQDALFSKTISSSGYEARATNNSSNTPLIYNLAKDFLKKQIKNSNYKARIIEDVCLSGSLDLETINETSTSKTLIYRYNNCNDGVKVINGTVEVTLGSKSGNVYYTQNIRFKDNYSVKYQDGSTINIANGGAIDITLTSYISENRYNFILDTTMKLTQNGYSFGYEGYEAHYSVKYNNTKWYLTTGIIYINNYKEYVIWDNNYDMSLTPYVLNTNGYPLEGEARFKMDGGNLRIIADNGAIVLDIQK